MSYLKLTVENGLRAHELKRKIAANLFETPKIGSVKTFYTKIVQKGIQQQQAGVSAINNLFKGPHLTSTKKLLSGSIDFPIHSGKYNQTENKEFYTLLQQTRGIIDSFIKTQNRRINAEVNMLFWNVGKMITESTEYKKDGPKIIKALSRTLSSEYGSNFKIRVLNQMCIYNHELPDFNLALRIAYLLPFEYIIVLFSVDSIEAKLFYARKASQAGLTVSELGKLIKQRAFENTKGTKKREQELLNHNKRRKSYTKVIKDNNSETHIISESLNIGNDIEDGLLTTNIFENKHFLSLIENHSTAYHHIAGSVMRKNF